jgi:two-component sensor histidine kinase
MNAADMLLIVAPPLTSTGSFGTSLIRDLIPHELGGSVDLVFETAGVSCKIEVPLERL